MYWVQTPKILEHLFPDITWSSQSDPLLQYTFDDGPNPQSTPYILDFLDEHNLKGTFFCLGLNAEKYPNLINEIADRGHQLGHHGYRHLSGWTTSCDIYIDNYSISKSILNTELYRPPYGKITWRQYQRLKKQSRIIMWNNMIGDFDQTLSVEDVSQNIVTNNAHPLIVMHDRPDSYDRALSALKYLLNQKSLI